MTRWLLVLTALCLMSAQAVALDIPPPDPDQGQPVEATAPPPFSAEVLQASFSVGESWRFEMHEGSDPAALRTMRIAAVSPTGITLESTMADADGQPLGEPTTTDFTWEELASHATYPAATTTIEATTVMVGEESHPATHYHVGEPDGSIIDATFATDLPGPPAHMTVTVGDQEVMEMTLLEHTEGT